MNLLIASTQDGTVTYKACRSVSKERHTRRVLKDCVAYCTSKHNEKGITSRPLNEIEQHIEDNFLLVCIDNNYLIALDVIESYITTDKILSEEFIYNYGGKTDFKAVTSVMDKLAEVLECSRIHSGTLACTTTRQHMALSRLYQRQGYEIESIILRR